MFRFFVVAGLGVVVVATMLLAVFGPWGWWIAVSLLGNRLGLGSV